MCQAPVRHVHLIVATEFKFINDLSLNKHGDSEEK